MENGTLLGVGATGDIGQGIVSAALQSGRKVIAAGRDEARLQRLAEQHRGAVLACEAGDIRSEAGAAALWERAADRFGEIADVVVSVGLPTQLRPLLSWKANELADLLEGNLLTHFIAAKTFLPLMPPEGMLIGIGGGTADFIFPQLAPVSVAHAGLRMLYRGLAKECGEGPGIRQLMVVSMVAGESNRSSAPTDWLSDMEVGKHVCAILDNPQAFPKPILELRSRENVGHP